MLAAQGHIPKALARWEPSNQKAKRLWPVPLAPQSSRQGAGDEEGQIGWLLRGFLSCFQTSLSYQKLPERRRTSS